MINLIIRFIQFGDKIIKKKINMNELAKSNKELYEQYGLILDGIKRYYLVPLNERVYDFDRCTPKLLYVEGLDFTGKSWLFVFKQFVNFLYFNKNINKDVFYDFKVEWSNAPIFSNEKITTNCFQVTDDLYASNNFSSIHYIWVIQDLIKYFKIDLNDCYLIVHVPAIGEPEIVKKEYILLAQKQFSEYLLNIGYKEESVSNAIKSILFLNKFLTNMNCGSNNIFLVDSIILFDTLNNKILNFIKANKVYDNNQIGKVSKILHLYRNYLVKLSVDNHTILEEIKIW